MIQAVKITTKIALIIFSLMAGVQIALFFTLYNGFIERYVEDQLKELQTRVTTHRDVLEQNFNYFTLNYIATLEMRGNMSLVVQDLSGNIMTTSTAINDDMKKILDRKIQFLNRNGAIIERDWKNSSYIATATPLYLAQMQPSGYVYMFLHTNTIQSKLTPMNQYFMIVALCSAIFTIIAIFFLSRMITNPILRMKEATEKMSQGNLDVELIVNGEDEVAQLSRSINRLAKDLRYVKQARNDFLSSISHELQTPLTYLKGYADLAGREHISEEERKHALFVIQDEAIRVSTLVKNLFDLAKMDHNAFVIETEPTDLVRMIREIKEKVRKVYDEKNITLTLDCPEYLICDVDEIRMQQVFINLLDNARKYSPPNTYVQVKIYSEQDHAIVEIKDQGYGIPEKDVGHIFDRLYRVEQSRARETGGQGLGLAIVKEVVEKHGGTIQVYSRLNQGTTMKILLPRGDQICEKDFID